VVVTGWFVVLTQLLQMFVLAATPGLLVVIRGFLHFLSDFPSRGTFVRIYVCLSSVRVFNKLTGY
jgi:hypothetical protein